MFERKQTYEQQLEGVGFENEEAIEKYINEQFRILAEEQKRKRDGRRKKREKEEQAREQQAKRAQHGKKKQKRGVKDVSKTFDSSGSNFSPTDDEEPVLPPNKIEVKWKESDAWLTSKQAEKKGLEKELSRTKTKNKRAELIKKIKACVMVYNNEVDRVRKQKELYKKAIKDFRNEWLTMQKGVVIGLKHLKGHLFYALCVWRMGEKWKSTRVPVDQTWIDEQWGEGTANRVRVYTEQKVGFYPTENKEHQGWMSMDTGDAVGLRWNEKRVVNVVEEEDIVDKTTKTKKRKTTKTLKEKE